jgi:hypothetical protein
MDHAWIACERVRQTVRMLMRGLGRAVHAGSHASVEEPLVFAVSNCHPTRVVLYAAAFQGGWRIEFMRSLRDVLQATRIRKPKAVFYDHATGPDEAWNQYCSVLASEGVPFILLAHKSCDEIFMVLLASGGYHAWGNPLSSEDIVKAVDLAEEVAGLSHAPVG